MSGEAHFSKAFGPHQSSNEWVQTLDHNHCLSSSKPENSGWRTWMNRYPYPQLSSSGGDRDYRNDNQFWKQMALLPNASFSSKFPPKGRHLLSSSKPQPLSISVSRFSTPQVRCLPSHILCFVFHPFALANSRLWLQVLKEKFEESCLSLGETASRASLLAILSASLFLVDPALAFKVNVKINFFICLLGNSS